MDFYQKVITLCRKKGVSRSKMADDIGISRSAPKGWEVNGVTPRLGTIKKIADYFGVPVGYFLNESVAETHSLPDAPETIGQTCAPSAIGASPRALSEQEITLLDIFSALDVIDRAKLLVYAETLREKDK